MLLPVCRPGSKYLSDGNLVSSLKVTSLKPYHSYLQQRIDISATHNQQVITNLVVGFK